MEIAKIAKLTKIYCGNLNSGIERRLQILHVYFIRYIEVFCCENYRG